MNNTKARRLTTRRTPAQERALYGGMSPARFAEAIGAPVAVVYALIEAKWFGWTKDDAGRRVPECEDVRRPGAANPQYKIHPNAVPRWFSERAVASGS